MYHDYFGLQEKAFSIAVNPRYLYMSDQHREALAHLLYGIQVGGFVMLTGEVGTGKTTIIRCLLEQLPADTDMAIVLNAMASVPELLSTICDELSIEYDQADKSVKHLVDALYQYLLDSHQRGRKTVLLIDEAQLLDPRALEQIRLLTNLETTTQKLLQIILVGQPELKVLLEQPSMRQLSQRITARFHLEALSLAETEAYIAHRLQVAGLNGQQIPFPASIIKKVHVFSGGIPRLINVICERMMLGAYGQNQKIVDDKIFEAAAREVTGGKPMVIEKADHEEITLGHWSLALVALVIVGGLFIYSLKDEPIAEHPFENTTAAVAPPSVVENAPMLDKTLAQSVAEVPSAEQIHQQNLTLLASQLTDFTSARNHLFEYLNGQGVSVSAADCVSDSFYVCERVKLSTWNDLKDINRPMVLTLLTDDRKLGFVTLIGLDNEHALLTSNNQEIITTWKALAALWNGDAYFIWRRAPSFEKPLTINDKGAAVAWVAEQFANLDGQQKALTQHVFTPLLKKRVELFQASNGLHADGIVGAQTLRKLHEMTGTDIILKVGPFTTPDDSEKSSNTIEVQDTLLESE